MGKRLIDDPELFAKCTPCFQELEKRSIELGFPTLLKNGIPVVPGGGPCIFCGKDFPDKPYIGTVVCEDGHKSYWVPWGG